jgi:hypothetical protein
MCRGLHQRIADSHEKLKRGHVWCRACGAHQAVDPVASLRGGWPTCCGLTMTIDAPSERAGLERAQ